jgi:hypothetical protein
VGDEGLRALGCEPIASVAVRFQRSVLASAALIQSEMRCTTVPSIAIEISIGALMDSGLPVLLLLVVAGPLGWLLLRMWSLRLGRKASAPDYPGRGLHLFEDFLHPGGLAVHHDDLHRRIALHHRKADQGRGPARGRGAY